MSHTMQLVKEKISQNWDDGSGQDFMAEKDKCCVLLVHTGCVHKQPQVNELYGRNTKNTFSQLMMTETHAWHG